MALRGAGGKKHHISLAYEVVVVVILNYVYQLVTNFHLVQVYRRFLSVFLLLMVAYGC